MDALISLAMRGLFVAVAVIALLSLLFGMVIVNAALFWIALAVTALVAAVYITLREHRLGAMREILEAHAPYLVQAQGDLEHAMGRAGRALAALSDFNREVLGHE